jgi:hypothetical protein
MSWLVAVAFAVFVLVTITALAVEVGGYLERGRRERRP